MNPANAQHFQDGFMKMLWDGLDQTYGNSPVGLLIKFYLWSIEHPNACLMIELAYLLIWLFCIWNCLNKHNGIDRLTWLFAIVIIPVFGMIFYLILANRCDNYDDLKIYKAPIPQAPQAKTERSIADAVNASIEESVRSKRKS